tara:strand:+ start:476 stop:1075 length:600 start_codon:yes stop_codon:yes gene_type:complete
MFRTLILIFLITNLSAHPVIFKNGKVFWLTQNPNYNDLRYGISKTSNWYLGFRLLEDRKEQEAFALINNNFLAKRWNNENSQANFYLLSSVGLSTENSKAMSTIGVHGDWENRRFMVMEMLEYYSYNSSLVSNTRLAFSPFTVDYSKVSTWLIAHYRVAYENENVSDMLIPVVRLFKRNYLFEIGSNGKDSFFTFMIHY